MADPGYSSMRLFTGTALVDPHEEPLEILWDDDQLSALHDGDPHALKVLVSVAVFETESSQPRESAD